jgi:hypothetical protein
MSIGTIEGAAFDFLHFYHLHVTMSGNHQWVCSTALPPHSSPAFPNIGCSAMKTITISVLAGES